MWTAVVKWSMMNLFLIDDDLEPEGSEGPDKINEPKGPEGQENNSSPFYLDDDNCHRDFDKEEFEAWFEAIVAMPLQKQKEKMENFLGQLIHHKCKFLKTDLARRVQDYILEINLRERIFFHAAAFRFLYDEILQCVLEEKVRLLPLRENESGAQTFSRLEFLKEVENYISVINSLREPWKKRIYFVQFLNYLISNRQVHVWPYPHSHRAYMEKIDEFEKSGYPLPWHRDVILQKVQ